MAIPAGSEQYSRDPLTGLPDEHLFRQQLPLEFARARDRERNAGLLAVRLDGIEALNDRFGRTSGDEAIRAVAEEIHEQVQQSEAYLQRLTVRLPSDCQ